MKKPRAILLILGTISMLAIGCAERDALLEVSTRDGRTLDCPTEEFVVMLSEIPTDVSGQQTPEQAMESEGTRDRLPAGDLVVEEKTDDGVTYIVTTAEGARVARVGLMDTPRGWFVMSEEQCG